LESQKPRASDFVATFLHELEFIAGALEEIESALKIGTDYATRAYFEDRRDQWLQHVATLHAGFKAFAAEWLEADGDDLIKQHQGHGKRWLDAAGEIEPDPALLAAISADLAGEWRRLAARLN
jgi:hypothetical protein